MSVPVESNGNHAELVRLYPVWYYLVQSLLMVTAGLIILSLQSNSSAAPGGLISLYLFLVGIISIISVISDKSEMGYKFLIGIFGIVVTEVSMYYFFSNIFSITEIVFLIFLIIMCFIIGLVQIMKGVHSDDPSTCLIGLVTVILGLTLVSYLFSFARWIPVVTGLVLLTGGLACYFLKNRRFTGRIAKKGAA